MPAWRTAFPVAGLWLAVVALAFWPALAGGAVYDDRVNFELNEALREFRFVGLCTQPFYLKHLGYWRPAASVAMASAYSCGGLFGVHLLAMGLHAAAAIVAHGIARRVCGDTRLAWLAAAWFALHPVQVESVAWASAVAEPLCGWFGLLAVRAALRWRDRAEGRWPWGVAGWLLAALLTMEGGITVYPLVLALLAVMKPPLSKQAWLRLVVAGAIPTGLWLLLRGLMLAQPFGVQVEAESLAWSTLGAEFAQMIVRPLLLLVAPHPLLPLHSLQQSLGGSASLCAVVWLAALGALAVAVVVAVTRGALPVRVGAVFLVVPLLLPAVRYQALGDHPIAERYLYLPAFGFALGLAHALRGRPWLSAGLLLLPLGLTRAQCLVWHDQQRFVTHCVEHLPSYPIAHILLGNYHLTRAQSGMAGELPFARAAYGRALSLVAEPCSGSARRQRAAALVGEAWCQLLAWPCCERHEAEQSAAQFRAVLACDDRAVSAWVGLGVASALATRFDDAEAALQRALSLDDRCPEAWFNLGCLREDTGRRADALDSFQRALRLDPGLTIAAVRIEQLK
jgi:Tfp pilus assembly protein PilF